MNSAELYNKLKNFWAKRTSGGHFSPPPNVKFPGKRYVFKWHGNLNAVWYRAKWMPVLPEIDNKSVNQWTRLTYEEFCYALGLEMIP